MGAGKWNARYGYGIKLKARGGGLTGDDYWSAELPPDRDQTIRLHKVHGSLHFKDEGEDFVLKKRPYGNPRSATGDLHFSIIAPESSKSYDGGRFGQTMQGAHRSLRAARRLVVIGYSLPPSDQHAESLFRFGAKKRSLDSLVVVNPDREARRRVRPRCNPGLRIQRGYCHSTIWRNLFKQIPPSGSSEMGASRYTR